MRNRSSLAYQVRYAARHPERIRSYAMRLARDTLLRFRTSDHVSYYRAVMRSESAKDADAAVGSATHERWLALGKLQFDYLREHGLTRRDHVLEIGCGNLRAGWRLIDFLDAGNYYGIDVSPEILAAAQRTVAAYGLQAKLPHLAPVRDLTLAFLPEAHFTVVHAHSVFSHSPIEVIDECLAHVGRVLHPDGFFDFTFNRTEGVEHQVLREDFYYHTETLTRLARSHGLDARFMDDWERRPHKQSKIRLTQSAAI